MTGTRRAKRGHLESLRLSLGAGIVSLVLVDLVDDVVGYGHTLDVQLMAAFFGTAISYWLFLNSPISEQGSADA